MLYFHSRFEFCLIKKINPNFVTHFEQYQIICSLTDTMLLTVCMYRWILNFTTIYHIVRYLINEHRLLISNYLMAIKNYVQYQSLIFCGFYGCCFFPTCIAYLSCFSCFLFLFVWKRERKLNKKTMIWKFELTENLERKEFPKWQS